MPVPRIDTSCVSLVGLPGTSLAAVAAALGRRLGLAVLDAERLVEAWYGCPLDMILKNLGPLEFPRAVETVLGHIAVQHAVIAVGSEALELPQARQRLRLLGPVVGLAAADPAAPPPLGATAAALLAGRAPAEVVALHRRLLPQWTDTVIDDGADPETLAARITEWLSA
jgi:shikimate kinase